jgi:hypothetical protein
MPDTVPLLRIDLATRKLDTVAYVKVQNTAPQVTREADGSIRVMMQVNPLPVVDDWVMTPSGTLALVRGRDYRVDWIAPDGARRSAPKLPFDWQRLSDEDKVALIDSVKAIRQRQAAAGGPGGGPGAVTMTFSGAPGGGAAPGGPARPPREGGERTIVMGGPGASGAPAMPGAPQVEFVSPSELPDYRPAFLPNATRADAEGNLWIRTTHTRGVPSGASVYDVVDPQGALIDRVQVPAGRTIVGFGAGGTVYLVAREGTAATATTTLERARVR